MWPVWNSPVFGRDHKLMATTAEARQPAVFHIENRHFLHIGAISWTCDELNGARATN